MEIKPVALSPHARSFKTIDSHTMGEPTRIVYDGFPEIPGETMMEKKKYVEEHCDRYRTALMLEPRGHRDMFGALLTSPVNPEADLGVIFMNSGGYLNMCGHGSIGAAVMAVETGMVEMTAPYTNVTLDAPAGLIHIQVHVVNGKAAGASLLNVPSFLYRENLMMDIPGFGEIPFDIAFGGSFFALVDAGKIGLELKAENLGRITGLGIKLREKINAELTIRHPYLDITAVDLVEFYARSASPEADIKNCVIFGDAQADRSPCGTGVSAKLAAMYTRGELKLNEPLVCESITGSLFTGEAVKETEVGGRRAIVPKITGKAYITGMNEWILDEDDPLRYGFLLGRENDGQAV